MLAQPGTQGGAYGKPGPAPYDLTATFSGHLLVETPTQIYYLKVL